MESFSEYFIGFQHHNKSAAVRLNSGVFYSVGLTFGAGTQKNLTVLIGVGASGQNRGRSTAAVGTDSLCYVTFRRGNNENQFAGAHMIHEFVNYCGSDEGGCGSIEDGIYISENRPSQRQNHQIYYEHQGSDGEMGAESFQGKSQKINSAGRGASHIKEGKSASCEQT